ncbi:MAG: MFS transporter, partial [Thermoproteus sp.]|nr:MFS transporter [Thermoproteus sp.]
MSALDSAKWGGSHWRLFAIISASFFLDGVLFSLVPATIYLIGDLANYATLIFATNSAAFLLGALALGKLSDALGRRTGLVVSLAIYTAASLVFAALYWAGALGLATALATSSAINFGVGGEIGPAYSALAELAPARHRGKA